MRAFSFDWNERFLLHCHYTDDGNFNCLSNSHQPTATSTVDLTKEQLRDIRSAIVYFMQRNISINNPRYQEYEDILELLNKSLQLSKWPSHQTNSANKTSSLRNLPWHSTKSTPCLITKKLRSSMDDWQCWASSLPLVRMQLLANLSLASFKITFGN